jgi:hypothetical protein
MSHWGKAKMRWLIMKGAQGLVPGLATSFLLPYTTHTTVLSDWHPNPRAALYMRVCSCNSTEAQGLQRSPESPCPIYTFSPINMLFITLCPTRKQAVLILYYVRKLSCKFQLVWPSGSWE